MKRRIFLLFALSIALPAAAEEAHHRAAGLTTGEVRKIDAGAKKITIKHGPIQNLDMPAMTMVFRVRDPAMLAQVKAGDLVKFRAERVGDALTVTSIEKAQ